MRTRQIVPIYEDSRGCQGVFQKYPGGLKTKKAAPLDSLMVINENN